MTYSKLQEDKVLVIRDFLQSEKTSSLSENFVNYCNLVGAGGDSQVASSRCVYNFLPFKQIMYDKVHHLNSVLGIKLFPTYCYARVYEGGSVLAPHVDREACEISVTLNLSGDEEWPIYFGKVGECEQEIKLSPGEAAVYLGREIIHWRNEFKGNQYVQVFLHYVNSEGPCALYENDRTPF